MFRNTFVAVAIAVCVMACSDSSSTPEDSTAAPSQRVQNAGPPSVSLEEAAASGNVSAIRQHVAAGSDLNRSRPQDGATALIIAATFDHTDVIKALAEGGVNLDQTNNDGSTALLTAAFLCREDAVRALLKAGADKEVRNNAGSTALEAVQAPWEAVKPIYQFIDAALAPAGISLDFEQILRDRPKIAAILQAQ